jgi:hypothetical protein
MSMNFPKEEERILARWKEIGAFLRQVELVGICDAATMRHAGSWITG